MNQIPYAHKNTHPKKVEIHVDGEEMHNAMEAQEDEWYTVEMVQPDKELRQFFLYVEKVMCKNVKIFEKESDEQTTAV